MLPISSNADEYNFEVLLHSMQILPTWDRETDGLNHLQRLQIHALPGCILTSGVLFPKQESVRYLPRRQPVHFFYSNKTAEEFSTQYSEHSYQQDKSPLSLPDTSPFLSGFLLL